MFPLTHFSEKTYHSKIPISVIKDKLEKHYRIIVSKKCSDFLNCIIVRRWRLIGNPWLGPHTRLKIRIKDGDDNTFNVSYRFFWPEYILYWVLALIIITVSILSASSPPSLDGIVKGVLYFILLALIFSVVVYIDSYLFYNRFTKLIL